MQISVRNTENYFLYAHSGVIFPQSVGSNDCYNSYFTDVQYNLNREKFLHKFNPLMVKPEVECT